MNQGLIVLLSHTAQWRNIERESKIIICYKERIGTNEKTKKKIHRKNILSSQPSTQACGLTIIIILNGTCLNFQLHHYIITVLYYINTLHIMRHLVAHGNSSPSAMCHKCRSTHNNNYYNCKSAQLLMQLLL